MPGSATAQVIFIAAMMILVLIISFAAMYFFFKTYAKEKREKDLKNRNSAARDPQSEI